MRALVWFAFVALMGGAAAETPEGTAAKLAARSLRGQEAAPGSLDPTVPAKKKLLLGAPEIRTWIQSKVADIFIDGTVGCPDLNEVDCMNTIIARYKAETIANMALSRASPAPAPASTATSASASSATPAAAATATALAAASVVPEYRRSLKAWIKKIKANWFAFTFSPGFVQWPQILGHESMSDAKLVGLLQYPCQRESLLYSMAFKQVSDVMCKAEREMQSARALSTTPPASALKYTLELYGSLRDSVAAGTAYIRDGAGNRRTRTWCTATVTSTLKHVDVPDILLSTEAHFMFLTEQVSRVVNTDPRKWLSWEAPKPTSSWMRPFVRASPLPKLPDSYDALLSVPGKRCKVDMPRSQGQCGSCTGFGMSAAISGRICVMSKGEHDVVLSVPELFAWTNPTVMGVPTDAKDGARSTAVVSLWFQLGLSPISSTDVCEDGDAGCAACKTYACREITPEDLATDGRGSLEFRYARHWLSWATKAAKLRLVKKGRFRRSVQYGMMTGVSDKGKERTFGILAGTAEHKPDDNAVESLTEKASRTGVVMEEAMCRPQQYQFRIDTARGVHWFLLTKDSMDVVKREIMQNGPVAISADVAYVTFELRELGDDVLMLPNVTDIADFGGKQVWGPEKHTTKPPPARHAMSLIGWRFGLEVDVAGKKHKSDYAVVQNSWKVETERTDGRATRWLIPVEYLYDTAAVSFGYPVPEKVPTEPEESTETPAPPDGATESPGGDAPPQEPPSDDAASKPAARQG